jgi:hypothetical protein
VTKSGSRPFNSLGMSPGFRAGRHDDAVGRRIRTDNGWRKQFAHFSTPRLSVGDEERDTAKARDKKIGGLRSVHPAQIRAAAAASRAAQMSKDASDRARVPHRRDVRFRGRELGTAEGPRWARSNHRRLWSSSTLRPTSPPLF